MGGVLTDGCGAENIPLPDAHPIIRQFAIGFLNAELRDSPSSESFFDAEAAEGHAESILFEAP